MFISHKSEEVFEIGDEITVLRNGELVGHYPVDGMDERRLLALMAGREVKVDENFYPATAPGDVVLDVQGPLGRRLRGRQLQLCGAARSSRFRRPRRRRPTK